MQSQAFIPRLLADSSFVLEIVCIAVAVVLVALVAQVSIPLPGTPIPITGQTFAVTLIALLLGWARAGAAIALYLAIGLAGAPVFADAGSGLDPGPTFGYLLAMAFAAVIIGLLADRGYTHTFTRALAAALFGAVIIFAGGVLGLSFFLPVAALLDKGVLPFVPGAMIKSVAAAGIACWLTRRFSMPQVRAELQRRGH
ncbi:MAG: biotin transporter BioY [Woeseiaceae bacterium]